MQIYKKTYETIIKTINWCNVCTNCNRTEKDLVGTSVNTLKNLNIFSVEGLCLDCEIILFPERFHGCGFCKRPIRERFCCTICSMGFIEWINNSIHPMNSFNEMVKRSAFKLVECNIYDLPEIENNKFILRNDDGYYKWPGFYAGITNRFSKKPINVLQSYTNNKLNNDVEYENTCTYTDTSTGFDVLVDSFVNEPVMIYQNTDNFIPVWIIPRVFKQPCFLIADIKLELDLFQNWLLETLESNNIYLYADVQIDAETISLEQIVKINPYDTRVIKRIGGSTSKYNIKT